MRRNVFLMGWIVLLAACGTGTTPPPPSPPPPPATPAQPLATPVGTPTGTAISAVIGAAGGSLSAADGRITVTVPAGALASDTSIGIQPISNNAHGGLGNGYRLTPEGTPFSKPVTLSFPYDPADLSSSAPSALGVAFQDAQGFWSWVKDAVLDQATQTVAVTTTHFSDWSAVKGWQIRPELQSVRPGKSVQLEVKFCFVPEEIGGLTPLGYACDVSSQELAPILPTTTVTNWSVNGVVGGNATVGTVAANGVRATYTAPSSVPNANPVAVSAEVTTPGLGKTLVVSNVTVALQGYTGTVKVIRADTTKDETLNASITWGLTQATPDADFYESLSGTVKVVSSRKDCETLFDTRAVIKGIGGSGGGQLNVFHWKSAPGPDGFTFFYGDGNTYRRHCKSDPAGDPGQLERLEFGFEFCNSDPIPYADVNILAGSRTCQNGDKVSWSLTAIP